VLPQQQQGFQIGNAIEFFHDEPQNLVYASFGSVTAAVGLTSFAKRGLENGMQSQTGLSL